MELTESLDWNKFNNMNKLNYFDHEYIPSKHAL